MIRFFGVVLCGLVLASAGHIARASEPTQSYEYRIRVPQTRLSCADEAQQLGARFAAATGIRADAAECVDQIPLTADGKQYNLYSLRLSYKALENPLVYSAFYGSSESYGLPTDTVGVYSTYDQCLAQVQPQAQNFQTQTGLQAVATTCLPGSYSFQPNYVLRIDGIGKPLKKLRRLEIKFLGHSNDGLNGRVDQMLTALGGAIVFHAESLTLLYAPDNFAVKHDTLGRFNTQETCTRELDAAQAIYGRLESRASIVECLPSYGTNYYLEAVREGGFFLSSDMGNTRGRFFSFDECTKDRAKLNLDAYAGGICHAADYAEGQFELELFSRL